MHRGKINVELLVSLVSQKKELYDKRDSDYKNLEKRELLWRGIADQLGFDVEEVKQKWRSLRDTYIRNKREDDCRIGQTAKNKKPWKFMKLMEFLAASNEFRSVRSDISAESMVEVVVQNDVSESEEAPASTASGSSGTSPTVTRSSVNKRKRSDTPDFLERYLLAKEAREKEKEERRREREEHREQRKEQLNDDNYLFALGLIPTLRRLSPAQQSSVKLKIYQLLHDAEFGQPSSTFFPQQSPASNLQLQMDTVSSVKIKSEDDEM